MTRLNAYTLPNNKCTRHGDAAEATIRYHLRTLPDDLNSRPATEADRLAAVLQSLLHWSDANAVNFERALARATHARRRAEAAGHIRQRHDYATPAELDRARERLAAPPRRGTAAREALAAVVLFAAATVCLFAAGAAIVQLRAPRPVAPETIPAGRLDLPHPTPPDNAPKPRSTPTV